MAKTNAADSPLAPILQPAVPSWPYLTPCDRGLTEPIPAGTALLIDGTYYGKLTGAVNFEEYREQNPRLKRLFKTDVLK